MYGSTCNTYIKQIHVQQNISLKILFQKYYRTYTHDLYKNLNLLNVQNIKNVQIANLAYKHKQSLVPPVFNEYFTWGNEVHSHVTCNSAKLHIRQPLNENGNKMLQYQDSYIWNKFQEAVKYSRNLFTFPKKWRSTILKFKILRSF